MIVEPAYLASFLAVCGRKPLYLNDPAFVARAAVQEPTGGEKLRAVASDLGEVEIKL